MCDTNIQGNEESKVIERIEAEADQWKARAETAEAKLAKAEACCASLSACLERSVMLWLKYEDANMLNLQARESPNRIPDGQQDCSSPIPKAVQGMPTGESQNALQGISGLPYQEGHAVEGKKEQVSRENQEVPVGLQVKTPGKIIGGLCETRPLQGSMQDSPEKCGCIGKNQETDQMSKVWVGRENTRAPRGLQQALRRAVALQIVPHETALEILNALSTSCGTGWLSPEKVEEVIKTKCGEFLTEHEEEIQRMRQHTDQSDKELCQLQDSLGCPCEMTDEHGALMDNQKAAMERIRDLIASEGELGDIKSKVKLLVEALERIHRIAKEVSQVTALPTEMQQMADVANQALDDVKPTL